MMQASSSEVAIEWVLTHMGDPDFNDPLPAATGQTAQPRPVAPHQLEAVMAMGFTADEVQHPCSSFNPCDLLFRCVLGKLLAPGSKIGSSMLSAAICTLKTVQPCSHEAPLHARDSCTSE